MDFEEVRQSVFVKKLFFKKTIDQFGFLSLKDYFSRLISAPCLISEERRKEFLTVFQEKVTSFFGKEIAEAATRELVLRNSVSTADHHGLLAHPFFLSCHLAQSQALQDTNYQYQFVFSCAGISLNNSSYPRSLLAHDENLELLKLPFFSLQHRHQSVYACESYSEKNLETIKKKIITHQHFSSSSRMKMLTIMEEIFETPTILSSKFFSDQITLANYHLWKKLPGVGKTKLIFLSQEELTIDLLLRFHLGKNTLFDRLFSEPSFWEAWKKNFNGLTGAFSQKNTSGTMLVWAFKDGERVSLWRKDNELITLDGTYRLRLTADNIREAFLKKEIMPSMALSFMVLSFYYGIVCGGGFSQVNYLTDLKKAFIGFLQTIEYSSNEEKGAADLITDNFTGEINYLFLEKQQKRYSTTAFDLILYQNENTKDRITELTEKCSLFMATDQMMPELYRIIYHEFPATSVPQFPYPSVLCLKNV